MAKKETKGDPLSLDDWNFGSEFDFDEFNMEPKPVKTKREAVERVASAALEGATDAIKSPSFFRDLVRKALPRGYGNMLDITDQAASTIRGLYNDGAKEIKPALRETAKVVDRLLPAGNKHLPKGAENLLKKFVEANKEKPQVGVGGPSAVDMAVAGLLQDTFRYNTTEASRREAKADAQQGIQDAIANNRHQDQIGQLEGIRKSVVSMAAYQRRIEFNFQKKSLELQARHYFVAVNMLNEQKRQNLKTTEMLSGILNNTALPDLLKMRASEKFKDMLRNKAMAGLQDGLFGQRDNFFQRLGTAFKEQAMGSIRELAQGVRDGAAGIEMAQDSAEMASEMGMDRYRLMGNMLGAEGSKWVAGLGAGRLGKMIDRRSGGRVGKFTKGIRRLGNKLQFGAENAPQIMTDWSNTATDVDDVARQYLDRTNLSSGTKNTLASIAGFFGNPIADLAKGTVRRANMQDTKVKSTGIGDMHTPVAFNNQAHRSLVEVIPGYLARILQEQQIARTGNASVDLVQYDFSRGAFSTTKAVRTAIFNKLFDEKSRGWVKDEQNRLLEMIDPMGKLTADQRGELGKILMNDNLRGRAGYETGRITNYLNAGNFGESRHGETYAKLFQKLNERRKQNGEGEVDNDFASRFRNVGRSASDRRTEIQHLLEIYPRETLEDMGIIKPGSEEIDMAQVHRYFAGQNYQAKGVHVEGGIRRLGRGRGGRGAREPSPVPQLGSNQASDNPVVAEIQKLILVIEAQSSKPLVAEIKTILEALKDELGQGGANGPSRVDQFMDVAGDAGRAARRSATRARRLAALHTGRFMQQNQGRIDAARQRGEDFLHDAQRAALRARRLAQVQAGRLRQQHQGHIDQASDFFDTQLQRGQDLWNDRPSLEQLRDMLTERLGQARTTVGGAFSNLRQRSQGVGARIFQSMEEGRQRLNERLQSDGLNKTNDLLGEIKDTLLGIQERLEDGILTVDANGIPRQGLLGRARGAMGRAGGAARRGLSRLNMRISDMVGLGFSAIKNTARFGGAAANWLVGGAIRGTFNAGVGALKWGGDLASRGAGNAYRRMRGFVDIYVGNERKPRIYGRLMQEGNIYFNRDTGKPVHHFKDITGTVVKRGPNGDEVVLEEDEIADAYQRQGPIKKTLKALGVVAKSAYGVGKKLTDIVLGGIPPVYRMAMWAGKKAWGMLLDAPQDIFVKDRLDEPVMLARVMRAGGYQSVVSGKIITRPSMIDGPVVTGEETVLTHDDIRKGLVDRNNKPIKTGLSKLLGWAFGGLKKAGQLAWKTGKLVNKVGTDLVKGGIKLGKKVVKGGIAVAGGTLDLLRGRNPFARGVNDADLQTVQVAAESNSLLKEIRDILRDRLPEKKKHEWSDTDGDGVRDGSYEDQMKKKAAADKAKAEQAAKAGQDKDGVGGEKKGWLASLLAKFRGKKDEDEDDEGGDTNIDINGGGNKETARDAKRARRLARRPGGSWKTSKGFWGKAKFLGSKGWGVAKGAGKIGLGLLGLEGLGIGGMLAGAGSAIAAGASAVGGAIATGAAAVAGAISLPVVLGVAAVAAVGVGAYYGYKYLTRKKLGLLSRIRYAQYGFFPTDKDHVNAVFGLEDKLKDAIIYGKEGAKLDAKRVDPKSLIKDFDVDEDDKSALNKWLVWFQTRFKPVFLTHVSALKGVAGNKWLEDVDDLDPPVAVQYLNATRFPEGPYGQDTSPFKDLKVLPAGAGDVRELIKIADAELQKKTKDSAGKAGVGGAAAVTAVAATQATAAAGKPQGQGAQVGTTSSGISKEVLAQAAASVGAVGGAPRGAQVGVAGSSAVLGSLGVDRLDGIDVVRMKTYGLVKMEVDKVRALLGLEKSVRDAITYSKNVASWSGSLEHILTANGPAFGVDISDEVSAANWLSWFNQRFLPVYLNYATMMKAQTGKDNPDDGKLGLKPTQIVDVATGIYTTTGNRGSVWNVSTSPWEGYELNVDVRSTDGNMQGLKENAKNAVLTEPSGKAANQPSANKSSANTSSIPKVGGALGLAWGGIKSAAQSAANAVKNAFSSGPPVGGSSGEPGGIGGGREIAQPGKGTAGDINAIPKPTGNRSWAALKDTILAAAKMVGVDGKLMAAMAAIESGFDHMVKAGTSSATGLYQFISDTWNSMLKKYGGKYGIAPGTPPTDARANALMGAEYIKDNMAALEGKIGRPLTDTDVYFAHFLGSAGAKKFLTADPNAIGASILPQAASANRGIFYDRNGAPLTVGQIYQLVNNRVQNKAKGFGINDGGEELVDSSKSTGSKASGEVPPASGGSAAPSVAGNDQAPKAGQPNTATPKTSSFGLGSNAPATASSGPTPQAPTATTDSAPTGPVNRGVPIGVMASGFVPPRQMQDQVNALRQMNEVRVSNLEGTNKLLEESVDIQGKMLEALNGISEKLGNLGGPAPSNAKPNDNVTPTSQAGRAAPQRASELPRAPVSVARPRAPY